MSNSYYARASDLTNPLHFSFTFIIFKLTFNMYLDDFMWFYTEVSNNEYSYSFDMNFLWFEFTIDLFKLWKMMKNKHDSDSQDEE